MKKRTLTFCIIYQTQEESTASASAAFHATSYSVSHFLCAAEVKIALVRPFYSEGLGLWRKNLARAVFFCHLLLWPRIKWKKPGESKVVFYIIGVLPFIVLHKSKIKVSKRKVGIRPVRELGDLDNLTGV